MAMSYRIEIEHVGLGKHRIITGRDRYVVERKAEMQKAQWDEEWERIRTKRAIKEDRENRKRAADVATQEAQEVLEQIDNLLQFSLRVSHRISFESLKSKGRFAEQQPERPSQSDYTPMISFWDKLFGRANRKTQEAATQFEAALAQWQHQHNEWQKKEAAFIEVQEAQNAAIDDLARRYSDREPDAISEYTDMVLSRSPYPDAFPKEFQTQYDAACRLLIIEYQYPSLDGIPTLKEVRYIASRNEFTEKHINEKDKKKLYDSACYQICLRTIHEIFSSDVVEAIDHVIFNGWVGFVDGRTGKDVSACILTVQADKASFTEINLSRVEPRECFRSLKGIGSAQLHGMTPVAPIMQLNKDDIRFVSSIEVASSLNEGTNLAAIGWEEFEHLIRELFAKEFSGNGAEVKVTRASRDGGVDAIAFDPDPIRGGKIVIQAKRYTNTVDVSSVRDLYGTVMNEGAIKGILVTTSTFGPDAYKFSTDKPLSLIDGGGLLHLLERHGHKARIDLAEAKQLAVGLKR